jgi:hypothetical protein
MAPDSPSTKVAFHQRSREMTLCPIALAASCKKCPAFAVCPLKTVIGDYKLADHHQEKETQTDQPNSDAK